MSTDAVGAWSNVERDIVLGSRGDKSIDLEALSTGEDESQQGLYGPSLLGAVRRRLRSQHGVLDRPRPLISVCALLRRNWKLMYMTKHVSWVVQEFQQRIAPQASTRF